MSNIMKTGSSLSKLQMPEKKGLRVDTTTKSMLGCKKVDEYVMSVNYVALMNSLTLRN